VRNGHPSPGAGEARRRKRHSGRPAKPARLRGTGALRRGARPRSRPRRRDRRSFAPLEHTVERTGGEHQALRRGAEERERRAAQPAVRRTSRARAARCKDAGEVGNRWAAAAAGLRHSLLTAADHRRPPPTDVIARISSAETPSPRREGRCDRGGPREPREVAPDLGLVAATAVRASRDTHRDTRAFSIRVSTSAGLTGIAG